MCASGFSSMQHSSPSALKSAQICTPRPRDCGIFAPMERKGRCQEIGLASYSSPYKAINPRKESYGYCQKSCKEAREKARGEKARGEETGGEEGRKESCTEEGCAQEEGCTEEGWRQAQAQRCV